MQKSVKWPALKQKVRLLANQNPKGVYWLRLRFCAPFYYTILGQQQQQMQFPNLNPATFMASMPMINAFGFAPFWNNTNFEQFLTNFMNQSSNKSSQKVVSPKGSKPLADLPNKSLFHPEPKPPQPNIDKVQRSSSNTVSQ